MRSWPEIPGRGEFVRLAFEFTSTPYKEDNSSVPDICGKGNPSHFAVPVLQIDEQGGTDAQASSTYLSQTPAILSYLAPILGLDGVTPSQKSEKAIALRRAHVQQVLLTVLDLTNEMHDLHHPVGSSLYYEDQKTEALRKAGDVRANRLPKFFTLFDSLLKENKPYLVEPSQITTADLTLFIALEGVEFALPRWVQSTKNAGKFPNVWAFQNHVREETPVKKYWDSERRKSFG